MALIAGDARANTGLAGALQTATADAYGEFTSEEARQQTAKFNNVLADAIVSYFKANAEIKIKTTDTGLPQYLVGIVATNTTGPASDKTLTNALV